MGRKFHFIVSFNAHYGKVAIRMGLMRGLKALMIGIEMPPANELMYVASTPGDKLHGACVISYQNFMDQGPEF